MISAGSDVLRLVPPLVITKEDIDEMIEIRKKPGVMPGFFQIICSFKCARGEDIFIHKGADL